MHEALVRGVHRTREAFTPSVQIRYRCVSDGPPARVALWKSPRMIDLIDAVFALPKFDLPTVSESKRFHCGLLPCPWLPHAAMKALGKIPQGQRR